uniref:tyrosine-type recombinase/integrase n=1 Tax=Streptomyces sp. SJL17-4 TaxID=2967224 RepID=UPI00403FFFCE
MRLRQAHPHPYTIRFRDALGKQREESGFGTQDDGIERLTAIYKEKKSTAPSVAEARRELGQQTVEEYAKLWRPRQRKMTEYSTGEHVDSSINVHIVPRLGSRKLNSITPIVVERFLDELEADKVGRGNQVNIFRTLKAILRDAYGKGAMADDPVKGVQEPEYVREKVVIPSLTYVKKALTVADDDLALEIIMMVGCGLRNGEARAVNVKNIVADDVYRVHEQIHSNTHKPAKLKHRKAGEFREVPLPRSVREGLERYEEQHGTTEEGYLLRGPSGYYTEPMERRRVQKLFKDLPAEAGVGNVQLPALLRLERARERHTHHRRGGMDGPQVHRGDVSNLSTLDAGQHHQGGSHPGCRPLGSGLMHVWRAVGSSVREKRSS